MNEKQRIALFVYIFVLIGLISYNIYRQLLIDQRLSHIERDVKYNKELNIDTRLGKLEVLNYMDKVDENHYEETLDGIVIMPDPLHGEFVLYKASRKLPSIYDIPIKTYKVKGYEDRHYAEYSRYRERCFLNRKKNVFYLWNSQCLFSYKRTGKIEFTFIEKKTGVDVWLFGLKIEMFKQKILDWDE